MTEYDNTDKGVLFKNDRKDSDRHPDYKGSINVGGRDFWLSAWIKDGAKGKFMSLSVKPKEEQAKSPIKGRDPISTGRPRQNDDLDDSIPFFMEWR